MRKLTEEQELYIKNNWGKESLSSLAKFAGCDRKTLKNKAILLGLEENSSYFWSEEEICKLKELSKTFFTCEEIANVLKSRTASAVFQKANELEIPLYLDKRIWTDEDKDTLKELWGYYRIETIAVKLHRSVGAIKMEANKLHLGPMIANNTDYYSFSDLSELFGISINRIRDTWIYHGLKIKKIRVSKKKYYIGVTIENLMRFLKSNQGLWDSKKLEKNALGPEPQWLLEKRILDINKMYDEAYLWTDEEKRVAIFWAKQRKSYDFIATKINRTPYAIRRFLENAGYSYLGARFWLFKEIKYVKENMHCMSDQEMAEHLHKDKGSVSRMRTKLSYKTMVYVPHEWTEEENNYIFLNYRRVPNYEIANFLGVSEEIFKEQLHFLKNRTHNWTLEEETYLRNFYKKENKMEMLKRFQVFSVILNQKLKELGIEENRKFSPSEINEARKQLLCVFKNLLEERKDNSFSR